MYFVQLTVPGLFGPIGEIAVLLVVTMEVVTDNAHVLTLLLNLAEVTVLETTQRLVLVMIIHAQVRLSNMTLHYYILMKHFFKDGLYLCLCKTYYIVHKECKYNQVYTILVNYKCFFHRKCNCN